MLRRTDGLQYPSSHVARVHRYRLDQYDLHSMQPERGLEELVHDIQFHLIGIKWRPKMGNHVEGGTVLTWTGKMREAKL
jgi:hypothetical protein